MNWEGRRVVVTGGAGFIGCNLVSKLLELGADIHIVDKLYIENPQGGISDSDKWHRKLSALEHTYAQYGQNMQLTVLDLESETERFKRLLQNLDIDTVFHLSAVFGGREFVNTRQADCSKMLSIDHNSIEAASESYVERFFYASSACVYPDSLQKDGYTLREDDILSTGEGFKQADNLYGWAKLMGELQCKVFNKEKGLKTSTARFLTVYGPGELDTSHAISALIEKALDLPYRLEEGDKLEVWGSGAQRRGFTYVDDITEGAILCAENITDGTPINLGIPMSYSIKDIAEMIYEKVTGNKGKDSPYIEFDKSRPEGPSDRALDITRARKMLGWEPQIGVEEGLSRTVDWHKQMRKNNTVKEGRF